MGNRNSQRNEETTFKEFVYSSSSEDFLGKLQLHLLSQCRGSPVVLSYRSLVGRYNELRCRPHRA